MIIDDMMNIKDFAFMSGAYKHEKRWNDDMSNLKETVGSLEYTHMKDVDHRSSAEH